MEGRPWFFDKWLLSLQEFDGNKSGNDVAFSTEPFWVQIHNLPLASMTREVGTQIGAVVGLVIKVDVDNDGLG